MIELLFSSNARIKLLKTLLLEGDGRFYVRELAIRTGLPVSSIHQELANLLKAGLVIKEQSGRQVYYSIDKRCPIISEIKSIFIKTVGVADVLKASLANITEQIEVAFIYGSIAKGTERAESDVDLFIIGDVSLGDIVEAIHQAEEELGREVNPAVFSLQEFRERIRTGEHFATSIMGETKLFLIGDDDELARIAE